MPTTQPAVTWRRRCHYRGERPGLYAEWVEEVAAMRVRIREMRELLVEKLAEQG